jgi:cytochrome c5
MGRRAKTAGIAVLLIAGLGVLMLVRTTRRGFSALDEPTSIEALMARTMRRLSVPSDLRDRKNPLPVTPEVLAEGREHFADHCATCHANDGRGQTAMGQKFYPRVPDMTAEDTQSQSDGALYATIENGIRLTAMPAFGDGSAQSARGSWALVHFIRHLPAITPGELSAMEAMNPRPRAEWERLREEEAFLAGGNDLVPEPPPAGAKAHHH